MTRNEAESLTWGELVEAALDLDRRNRSAAFELEVGWKSGVLSLPRIVALLRATP